MLTHKQIDRLPQHDQAVARAAQAYYCGLLTGIPKQQRQQRLEIWWRALRQRWPDTCFRRVMGSRHTVPGLKSSLFNNSTRKPNR